MPETVPIAVEHLAKLIALHHGGKIVMIKGGESITVAKLAGCNSTYYSLDDYTRKHWREYIQAAEAVISFKGER